MLKKSKVAENFKRYRKFKSCRKFAEQLVAKPSEERLSSLIILRIHKHTNVDIDKVVSEFSRHFRGPKNKNFLREYAPDPSRSLRLRCLFHYAFLCALKRKNHASPLTMQSEYEQTKTTRCLHALITTHNNKYETPKVRFRA